MYHAVLEWSSSACTLAASDASTCLSRLLCLLTFSICCNAKRSWRQALGGKPISRNCLMICFSFLTSCNVHWLPLADAWHASMSQGSVWLVWVVDCCESVRTAALDGLNWLLTLRCNAFVTKARAARPHNAPYALQLALMLLQCCLESMQIGYSLQLKVMSGLTYQRQRLCRHKYADDKLQWMCMRRLSVPH